MARGHVYSVLITTIPLNGLRAGKDAQTERAKCDRLTI
jgi:hypothetical protein